MTMTLEDRKASSEREERAMQGFGKGLPFDTRDGDPVFKTLDVSPLLAQEWLGLNSNGRRSSDRYMRGLLLDVEAGRFLLNGETVKFTGPEDAPTCLIDGQERLRAILKSNVTTRLSVAFNIAPEARPTIGGGRKVTAAQIFGILGGRNATTTAAAVAIYFRVAEGFTGVAGVTTAKTNMTMATFLQSNPDIARSSDIAQQYAKRADVKPSVVAYAHWRMSKLDLDDATRFWRDAAERVEIAANDPIRTYMRRVQDWRHERETPYSQGPTNFEQLWAIFRTWNARRSNEPLERLRIPSEPSQRILPELV